jgi:hypothetical protein
LATQDYHLSHLTVFELFATARSPEDLLQLLTDIWGYDIILFRVLLQTDYATTLSLRSVCSIPKQITLPTLYGLAHLIVIFITILTSRTQV